MKEKDPLVSIVVITYNSSKYVLETLESAKAQTYDNIELIISDDGSTDETIEICKDWLDKNRERFKYSKLITVQINTGIPANCNRGVSASSGEWIKTIAGDDMIHKDCIENYLRFILQETNNTHFIYSNVIKIDSKSEIVKEHTENYEEFNVSFSNLSPEKQFNFLVNEHNKVWAATWMFSKILYNKVGGFNEKYRCFEDRPFLIEATRLGYKLNFLSTTGSYYRIHNDNLQKTNLILSCYQESKLRYTINELSYYISKSNLKKAKYTLYAKTFLKNKLNNKKTSFVIIMLSFLKKFRKVF